MKGKSRSVFYVLLFCLLDAAAPARADTTGREELPPVHWGADAKAYVTAPLHAEREQWVKFGGTVAAVVFAYQYDNKVHAHFFPEGTAQTHGYNKQDALPGLLTLGGTWFAARARNDPDGRREAVTMFEAAVFATTATEVMAKIIGRQQPNIGARSDFREGGDAFPSGHAAFAFAVGTVMAESGDDRRRWLRRVLGYGIGVFTAYQRMNHDEHWLSDTVAGAGVGIATARFLMKRHSRENDRSSDRSFMIVPTADGVLFVYAGLLRH